MKHVKLLESWSSSTNDIKFDELEQEIARKRGGIPAFPVYVSTPSHDPKFKDRIISSKKALMEFLIELPNGDVYFTEITLANHKVIQLKNFSVEHLEGSKWTKIFAEVKGDRGALEKYLINNFKAPESVNKAS